MSKIKLLDSALINKIAAGEVIERPASVVKELLENSIDAGATDIKIEIKEGGKSYIKIVDNGTGMSEEDVKLSFQRHATSKINDASDLFNINTLGFRGEALASIASISNLKLTTKTEEIEEGIMIEVEADKIIKEKKLGCQKGTIVEVSQLFFNTPVRKKYLKDMNYEFNKIMDIVTRYSLQNNNISIKLLHNGKYVFNSPKGSSILDKIVSLYGKEIAKQMIEVDYDNHFKIKGFISKPSLTRADKSQQSIFVNGRYVLNSTITDAVYEGYKTLLFHGRHPVFVIYVEIDPRIIDVNIHPTKKEIMISREKDVYSMISEAIRDSLSKNDLIPSVEVKESSAKPTKKYSLEKDKQEVLMVKEESKPGYDKLSEKEKIDSEEDEKKTIGPYKIIGQINKMYILAESGEGLMIVDQHAAQERILYEEFMKKFHGKGLETQKLVRPVMLELSKTESNTLKNNLKVFTDIGFEIEEYGKESFVIRAVPYIFDRFDKNLFMDIFSEIENIEKKRVNEIKEERIIRFACRKAIKAGLELTNKQMEELLDELEKTENPYTCPHGRPTIVNITLAELERMFKRVG